MPREGNNDVFQNLCGGAKGKPGRMFRELGLAPSLSLAPTLSKVKKLCFFLPNPSFILSDHTNQY